MLDMCGVAHRQKSACLGGPGHQGEHQSQLLIVLGAWLYIGPFADQEDPVQRVRLHVFQWMRMPGLAPGQGWST